MPSVSSPGDCPGEVLVFFRSLLDLHWISVKRPVSSGGTITFMKYLSINIRPQWNNIRTNISIISCLDFFFIVSVLANSANFFRFPNFYKTIRLTTTVITNSKKWFLHFKLETFSYPTLCLPKATLTLVCHIIGLHLKGIGYRQLQKNFHNDNDFYTSIPVSVGRVGPFEWVIVDTEYSSSQCLNGKWALYADLYIQCPLLQNTWATQITLVVKKNSR